MPVVKRERVSTLTLRGWVVQQWDPVSNVWFVATPKQDWMSCFFPNRQTARAIAQITHARNPGVKLRVCRGTMVVAPSGL